MKKCTATNCNREVPERGSGYCPKHLARIRKSGTTEITRRENGLGALTADGYISLGSGGRRVLEHVAIAEKALGRPLPPGAIVHHVNEVRSDNRPSNLVICPSQEYHLLLHTRARAYDACGHADWRKCSFCKQHADPAGLVFNETAGQWYHQKCAADWRRNRRAEKRANAG